MNNEVTVILEVTMKADTDPVQLLKEMIFEAFDRERDKEYRAELLRITVKYYGA